MKRIRGKLSFSNVTAVVALFVALGGSAYAATQLPRNSVGSKQLKPDAVTPAKLSPAAESGLQGDVGPTGPAGPQGASGLEGPPGVEGPPGAVLSKPTLPTMLPVGESESGQFAALSVANQAASKGVLTALANISFPVPLSSAPTPHYVPLLGPSSPSCPGEADEPVAAAGQLCLYETDSGSTELATFAGVHPATSASPTGTVAFFTNSKTTNIVQARGVWVVTAP